MADFDRESMQEMFIYEMSQLLEQLEQIMIAGESGFSIVEINEIFRIMHTIKGSAAMMMYTNISTTAHCMEDLFFYLREENPDDVDYSTLTDLIFEGMDFIKVELSKIESGETPDGNGEDIIIRIKAFLKDLKGESGEAAPKEKKETLKDTSKKDFSSGKPLYKASVNYVDESEMENVRAFTLVNNLKTHAQNIKYTPEDVLDESSAEFIRRNGFKLEFESDESFEDLQNFFENTICLKDYTLESIPSGYTENDDDNIFYACIKFREDSEMENVRAFALINNVSEYFKDIKHYPENLSDEDSLEAIRNDGIQLYITTDKDYEETHKILSNTIYLKDIVLEDRTPVREKKEEVPEVEEEVVKTELVKPGNSKPQKANPANNNKKTQGQHVISVNVSKLDQLLNLMGELVIAEAMVTQNPELEGLELESFHKETRQLRKIINDVQDTLMSMRMMPLSTTFFKMHRIVRDMCKSLDKDVQLEIIGEETEVDKNIIEHISDPLMHIIRNSIDHGIEPPEERIKAGKSPTGTVVLEAKNSGGDVLIIIRDDGAGLNKEKIMAKAKKNGLLKKEEDEYTDKEIYQFIFLPGFSTNEVVTGYSGRGVGMDVVCNNIEAVGGTVHVDSVLGEGTTFILKIPLTLAIIEGMTIRMGNSKYTIPIISIKQSFKPSKESLFNDPNGNEMITVRGECYNVIRLSEFFNIESSIDDLEEGIMIMIENGDQTICLLVDELIGEQQVVVKTIPSYLKKIKGLTGCTLLGNGDISLIIDAAGFFDK